MTEPSARSSPRTPDGTSARSGASGMVHAYAARRTVRRDERARWDEMVGYHGRVRRGWRELSAVAESLGPLGLAAAAAEATRLLEEDGVTYRPLGAAEEQTWGLDPLPLFIDEAEWAVLEPGLVQRAELLDALLHDLYGPRTTLRFGVLPNEIVHAHPGFLRVWDGVAPHTRQLFLAAADLGRGQDGGWCVLADRVQAPSGAGYAMANRRVVSRVLPALHRQSEIHRLGPFFHAMRMGLEQMAPPTAEAPRAVLLTPGTQSETAFEQAYLSTLLGYPLVRGEDLIVADGRVWQQTLGRLEQVDVVLRRVDSWFCDPLDLRADSELGVPGLVEAARTGSVSVVNGLGSGVLENPGLLPFLPALCQQLLDEPLRLKSVPTWWCGDADGLALARKALPRLVIKPLWRGVARTHRYGWELSAAEQEDLLRRIETEPYAWVVQEALACSTAPSIVHDDLFPHDLTLRTFAVASGSSYQVMPGGVGQVRTHDDLTERQTPPTSKDVWIRNTRGAPTVEPWVREATPSQVLPLTISPRVTEDMFWLGRYAERAEDTARLLRAVNDRWADFHNSPEHTGAAALAVLLETLTQVTGTTPGFLGVDADTRFAGQAGELLSVILDDQREGTLAFAVRRLTEVSQDVREQLSTDTWLVLGGLERELDALRHHLRGGPAFTPDVPTAIGRVLEGLLALSGLIAESLVRDAGWRFCEIGRRIERALHVTTLLASSLTEERAPQTDSLVLESVLIAAESIITYRRRHQSRAGVGTVLDLLLADRENPRAVAFQLDRLGEALDRLPAAPERTAPALGALADLRGAIRNVDTTTLALADTTGRRRDLRTLLTALATQLEMLAVDVERIFFVQPAPQRPLDVSVTTWESW